MSKQQIIIQHLKKKKSELPSHEKNGGILNAYYLVTEAI